MAVPPPPGKPAKRAHPSHFEENVLYEFDHLDRAGKVTHRKVKVRGFVVRVRDLGTGAHLDIDIKDIRNIQRYAGA